MTHMERVEQMANLETLGDGAASEKFSAELKAVLENIRDPNTEATATRKVVLEFTFKPQADRELVAVGISARSVFAATKPTSEVLFIARHDGEVVGTVLHGASGPEDPRQGVLPIEPRMQGGAS